MNSTNDITRRIGETVLTLVAITVGLFTLADLFFSQSGGDPFGFSVLIGDISSFFVTSTAIIVAFALLLGFVNVVNVHWGRVQTRNPGAIYSAVLLLSLAGTVVLGLGGPTSGSAQFVFSFILQPLEATFFALLAFFIVTAAFRAFRVNNLETFFFVVFAAIVLLGQAPISIYLWEELPLIKDWIINVPALAGVRGILLGVALGAIATGLRILTGADRPYSN